MIFFVLFPDNVLCTTMLIIPFRRLGTFSFAASHLKTKISASGAPQGWWRRVTRAGWGQL